MARNRVTNDVVPNGHAGQGIDGLRPCEGDAAEPTPSWVSPSSRASSPGFRAASDADFARDYPTLYDFVSLTGWGGKQRKAGTFLVFLEDAKWKACINDKDGGHYAFLSADSFTGLLGALDRALKQGTLDWRESKGKR